LKPIDIPWFSRSANRNLKLLRRLKLKFILAGMKCIKLKRWNFHEKMREFPYRHGGIGMWYNECN